MNIVNFTPITATLGGMIIGLAVVIFFLFNGRLVGISGIASNALTEKDNKFDNQREGVILLKKHKEKLPGSLGIVFWKCFVDKNISANLHARNSRQLLEICRHPE